MRCLQQESGSGHGGAKMKTLRMVGGVKTAEEEVLAIDNGTGKLGSLGICSTRVEG